MSLQCDNATLLFQQSARYRRWFRMWWEADFSVNGRKAALRGNHYTEKYEFAGRIWPMGWAPPHDLNGVKNERFAFIDGNSNRQNWWQYIRSELSGAFISEFPSDSPGRSDNLAYCFFDGPISLSFRNQNADLSRIYASKKITISDYTHSTAFDLTESLFLGGVHFAKSSPISYTANRVYVFDDFIVDSGRSDGKGDGFFVSGNFRGRGSFQSTLFRCKDLSFSEAEGSQAKLSLSRARASKVSLSGSFTDIACNKCTLSAISVDLGVCQTATFSNCVFERLTISGRIQNLELQKSRCRGSFSIRMLYSKSIQMDNFEIDGQFSALSIETETFSSDESVYFARADFSECKFSKRFSAAKSVFRDVASFAKCAFPGEVSFPNTHFQSGLDFRVGSGATISADNSFSHIGEADFSGATFDPNPQEVCANFDGRQTLEAANFELARFNGIPMFFGCKFHENVSFRGASFKIRPPNPLYREALANLSWPDFIKDIRSSYRAPLSIAPLEIFRAWSRLMSPMRDRRVVQNRRMSRYERAYNALRQRFSEIGNAKFERQFHTYELRTRSRRLDADAPPAESIISWLYDGASQYGQSISRPLLVLVCVFWSLFALTYLIMAGSYGISDVVEAGSFSARQIVKPFSAWSRDFALSASALPSTPGESLSPWLARLFEHGQPEEIFRVTIVRILASVQSVGGIAMLFWSGLAIRRTFGVS